ncbi:MAG TPA: hypothetical protein VH475_13730 [Tepidisphaeraceae bacterium]|jgi:hypothetical protein
MRLAVWFSIVCPLVWRALPARGADAPADPPAAQQRIDALAAEVTKLKAELETLRAENAALKQKLAAATAAVAATTRPATTRAAGDLPVNRYELGDAQTLGNYQFRVPLEWTAAPPPKDNKLQALFRSPDKQAVILIVVKPKGAAPAEMQAKYAQNVVQMLKTDFARNKTEVVEPPAAVPDPRFYLKVHERIKVKGDKTADQTHLYLMPNKDMVELTVITTTEATDQLASTTRLAEEILMSVAPRK